MRRAIFVLAALLTAQAEPRPRPSWVKEGIVMAGNWEPLIFIRRRGGHSQQDEADWPRERTAEVAKKLKAQGINLVITNFHKGFGLKTEAEDIEAARRFVEYAHREGLRVGGYIGASMMYETFFAEEPEARGWMQVDERGAPVYYLAPGQSFRYMACRNNPGYGAFLEKLLRFGVEQIGFDLIHFDQMESWTEPNVCRCRFCAAQFRKWLRAKYTDAQLRARFGFKRLDDVVPPPVAAFVASGAGEITNPLMQDWVAFRAASYARRYGEYDAALAKLNPQVALEGNPNLDGALNKATRNAVDVPALLAHGDIVWSEEPQQASWTADGRLVSKIRSFKMARQYGKSLFVYTGGRYGADLPESPPHLRIAEAMAFNDMNLGMVGDVTPEGVVLTPEAQRYIAFFHAHKQVLAGSRAVADVAVLRSFASVEFNPSRALVSTVLFEQSLIQARVPFDILFDDGLADLSKYRVLVMADQDALSDAQVEMIRRFTAAGGGVVSVGATGTMTEGRVRRSAPALARMRGVITVPRVVPAVEPPAPAINYRFDNRCWQLPRNHAELIAAVERAAGSRRPVEVSGPPALAIELARNSAATLLHLVNFDVRHSAANVDVSVEAAADLQVRIESPDAPGISMTAPVRNGRATFRIPRVKVYALAVLAPTASRR